MANDEFRADQAAAREAGLKARQERRLENATYTAAEVKVLTAKARQETAEEIADKLETVALNEDLPPEWPHVLSWAAGLVREIGAKEASA